MTIIRTPEEKSEWWNVTPKRKPKDWEVKVLHAIAAVAIAYTQVCEAAAAENKHKARGLRVDQLGHCLSG